MDSSNVHFFQDCQKCDLGIILLFFPFGTKLIMGFLAMLVKSVDDHPQERTR